MSILISLNYYYKILLLKLLLTLLTINVQLISDTTILIDCNNINLIIVY